MFRPQEVSATLSAASQVLAINVRGLSTLSIQVFGSMSATVQIEGTVDGTNWVALNSLPLSSLTPQSAITAAGVFLANVTGLLSVRLRCSAYTSGTPTMFMRASEEGFIDVAGAGSLGGPLPVQVAEPGFSIMRDATANNSVRTLTVPAGKVWYISALHALFASTATVGNRLIECHILDASDNIVWNTRSAVDHPASSGWYYNCIPGGRLFTNSTRQEIELPLPQPCILPAGYKIKIFDRAAIDAAADDITSALHVIEKSAT